MPSHQALEAALTDASAGVSAAGSHGMLCAQLCAPKAFDAALWLREVLGVGTVSKPAMEQCAALLGALTLATTRQMDEGEYALRLLLPEDERALPERVDALSQWCEGFLYGLGLGGLEDPGTLGPAGSEFVSDLSAICRAEAAEGGELDEQAYTELVEYVRVGALVVSEALRETAGGKGV